MNTSEQARSYHLSSRVPEIKPISLSFFGALSPPKCIGNYLSSGEDRQASDVDLKGYFLIQPISFRKYYELCREIMSFW